MERYTIRRHRSAIGQRTPPEGALTWHKHGFVISVADPHPEGAAVKRLGRGRRCLLARAVGKEPVESILALALIVRSRSDRLFAGRLNDQAVIVFYAFTTRVSLYTRPRTSTLLGFPNAI